MRSSSTNKKFLTILTVLFIAIIFITSTVSCKPIDPDEGITEETGEDPASGITDPDGPDTDKPDADSGQAAAEDREKDI